jgi:hypothetical protein
MAQHGFELPPFARRPAESWKMSGCDYEERRKNKLGWDITDFGSGDFLKIGLLLFTLRNGNAREAEGAKPYAEKIMIVQEGQITPMHFHWAKMEDIINRGGGNLLIQVYNSTIGETLADTPVVVSVDGYRREIPAGETLRVCPGESITMSRKLYHSFWGEPGYGTVLVGEVSQVNDDDVDNRFLELASRFPPIEEDEEAQFLLCNEYPVTQ